MPQMLGNMTVHRMHALHGLVHWHALQFQVEDDEVLSYLIKIDEG